MHKVTDDMVYQLRQLQQLIYTSNVEKGWYTHLETGEYQSRDFVMACALIHSEISEAFEGWRKNRMDEHLPTRSAEEVELADAMIRILDTAGSMNMDLAAALREKFAFNQVREDHTLGHRRGDGGKKV